jgi:hypothetical protein
LHGLLRQIFIDAFARFIAILARHPGCIYFFNRGLSQTSDTDSSNGIALFIRMWYSMLLDGEKGPEEETV